MLIHFILYTNEIIKNTSIIKISVNKREVLMKGFIDFIKEQGVISLAIAFIIGSAVVKLVNALVQDIINPIIALVLGNLENLSSAYFKIGDAKIMWGDFVSVLIDFIIVSLVVYFIFIVLGLKYLDKNKKIED